MPIRVLIIDDSSTMRAILRHVLSADAEIEVVGEAADPYEARTLVKRLNPDVLTLDIEMPRMDGVEFLKKLMAARPMPVVMVSSLTTKGADLTMQALEYGAVDFVTKPSGQNIVQELAILTTKVKAASRARVQKIAAAQKINPAIPARARTSSRQIVVIGASTGGVDALRKVVMHFPADCPPTLIVQHMPAKFTASFAARLDACTPANVVEADMGMKLRSGHIYLAPGGERHMQLSTKTDLSCTLFEGEPVNGHRPSVDVLFKSAKVLGKRVCGVILTGMGNDGAEGLKQIRLSGGRTIGQDEATSVVYGMPRVAAEIGAVEQQLALDAIGPAIMETCYA